MDPGVSSLEPLLPIVGTGAKLTAEDCYAITKRALTDGDDLLLIQPASIVRVASVVARLDADWARMHQCFAVKPSDVNASVLAGMAGALQAIRDVLSTAELYVSCLCNVIALLVV